MSCYNEMGMSLEPSVITAHPTKLLSSGARLRLKVTGSLLEGVCVNGIESNTYCQHKLKSQNTNEGKGKGKREIRTLARPQSPSYTSAIAQVASHTPSDSGYKSNYKSAPTSCFP